MVDKTISVLSNKVRRDILLYLRNGSRSAGEISEQFHLTKATISHHLSRLKEVDLVIESRYKNFVYYELNTSVFEEIILWFMQFKGDDINE